MAETMIKAKIDITEGPEPEDRPSASHRTASPMASKAARSNRREQT
jgi:hypothetical protein